MSDIQVLLRIELDGNAFHSDDAEQLRASLVKVAELFEVVGQVVVESTIAQMKK